MLSNSLGQTHHQGPGKLLSKSCNVKFHFYIPQNLEQSPYVILVSTGIHTHPPPPPVKPPSQIVRALVTVIQQMNTLNLTGSMYWFYIY